jgi:hypothetical protein
MKIARRSGISQSLDLFIIIAVVLACGGIVAAAATGLIGSASSSTTLQVVQSSLVGGTTPQLSLTIKNVGTQTITAASPVITLNILGATGATCPATGSTTWTGACTTTTAYVAWTGSSASLAPGSQVSFGATLTGITITSGATYSVSIVYGTASLSVKLLAQ